MNRVIPLLSLSLVGCVYDEGLIIENLRGTVHLPAAAATRDILDPNGQMQTVQDVRLLGPVILGLYPSISPPNTAERYPYPEVGPQFKDGVPGDTYPYGGTTVGDIRFACFEFLSCKVTSGRFVDYQDMIDWFQFVGTPVVDAAGAEIENGEYLRQTCYDVLNATTDDEIRITAYEDRNDDGTIDEKDLDFVFDEAANEYVGEFTIWQQQHFWDQNQENCTPGKDCTGFSLWGWMDAPSTGSYTYATCDAGQGYNNLEYNNDFFGGRTFEDSLNFPSKYITDGDWVVGEPFVWSNIEDKPDIYLDFPVE